MSSRPPAPKSSAPPSRSSLDFALLAPIPDVHIPDSIRICASGKYVSFGTRKWELFREIDKLRKAQPVPVLIYPSHEDAEAKTTFRVRYAGWYVGHTQDDTEKRKDEAGGHRPATTETYRDLGDSATGWPVFWRLEGLRPLADSEACPIAALEAFKSGYWRKNAPPRGPEIVARPNWL